MNTESDLHCPNCHEEFEGDRIDIPIIQGKLCCPDDRHELIDLRDHLVVRVTACPVCGNDLRTRRYTSLNCVEIECDDHGPFTMNIWSDDDE